MVEDKVKEKIIKYDTQRKVEAIVSKHNSIEKELSSGKVDPKKFAEKSKEYSDLELF